MTWKNTLRSLGQPKVAVMLALGFSAGLPFLLVGNTLGFWLREAGITLATIGFLSWVGLAYSFKFLWAPMIDKFDAPLVGRWLGRRRGWMLISQILILVSLIAMAIIKPEGGLALFTALAALAAFASSTQDIVIDAWRIEISDASEEMALLSSAYQLGYRAALYLTETLILFLAAAVGWSVSYTVMGAAMAVGILATLVAREPKRTEIVRNAVVESTNILRRIYDGIAGPFIAFFKQFGKQAVLILAAISLYRLADFVMGPMANPFYIDRGLTLETVAAVKGTVGIFATIAGVASAGLWAVRFGFRSTLLVGAILGPASNIGFSVLAWAGASTPIFVSVIAVDGFSTGFAGTALVGYMSSLTTLGYTATQYALLSSFYALLGKSLKGLSGVIVEQLQVGRDLMSAYAIFFTGTALIGVPTLVLCIFLVRNWNKSVAASALPESGNPDKTSK